MTKSLGRATAVMAAGTMTSRVLGFAKAILLAYAIGQTASVSADAFNLANTLPNTVYVLLLGGMLNAVLVPQIVKAAKASDGGSAYINKLLTLVIVALGAITVAAMVLAPFLVWIYALSASPDQLSLAAAFAYWCLPQVLFYGIYTVLGEVLNAKGVFGPFTWAPVLNNVVSILGILGFIWLFGQDPDGLRSTTDWTFWAIAVLAGSATLGVVLQALVLFGSWRRAGIRYRPDFNWRGAGLGEAARLSAWSLGMIVAMQLAGLITSNVVYTATGEGPATAALANAWLIIILPHSVFAVSLATAYFTRFSEHAIAGKIREFVGDFSAAVRQIGLVMIFATVLIFATAPLLSRVMQVGANVAYIDSFALVLQVYVLTSLVPYSLLFSVPRGFDAFRDTRTPFFITLAQLAVLGLASVACLLFVPAAIRGAAAAAAFGVATIVQLVLATWLLRRKLGDLDLYRIVQSLVRATVAALIACAGGFALTVWLRSFNYGLPLGFTLAVLFAVSTLMLMVFFVLLWLMRAAEIRQLVASVLGRFGR